MYKMLNYNIYNILGKKEVIDTIKWQQTTEPLMENEKVLFFSSTSFLLSKSGISIENQPKS